MSIAERLKILADFEGNQSKLAAKIETTSQSINQTIKQNRGIRTDTLDAIARAYPQLNMRWFITGEGEPGLDLELPATATQEDDPEKEVLKDELLAMYKDKVKMLEREIKAHCAELAKRLELEHGKDQ